MQVLVSRARPTGPAACAWGSPRRSSAVQQVAMVCEGRLLGSGLTFLIVLGAVQVHTRESDEQMVALIDESVRVRVAPRLHTSSASVSEGDGMVPIRGMVRIYLESEQRAL